MNQPIHYIVVEDEIPSRQMLVNFLSQLKPHWHLAGETGSVRKSITLLKQHPTVDLLFLDIELSDGLSFEILEQVPSFSGKVIFVTAYEQYAIRAFKVNSVDYILKPVKESELLAALEKFENNVSPPFDQNILASLQKSLTQPQHQYRERLMISQTNHITYIPLTEVALLYYKNPLTYVYTLDGKKKLVSYALNELENEVNPQHFFRVNRQMLMHVNTIEKVELWFKGKLLIQPKFSFEEQIIVSKDKASAFKQWLNS